MKNVEKSLRNQYFNPLFKGIGFPSLARASYKALGLTDKDLEKPVIGIANASNELSMGHAHLKEIVAEVKKGILQNGGVPLEFGVFSMCGQSTFARWKDYDYELAMRDALAADIEITALGHMVDGLVVLASCDSTIPGVMMGAIRVNVPSIMVTGGPMYPGKYKGRDVTDSDLWDYVFALGTGKVTEEEVNALEDCVCPGPVALSSL